MNLKPPAIFLFLFSPLVGEVLLGSTTISHIYLFPLQVFLYGSGAMLIREILFLKGFSWVRVMLLGVAFALIEEGLADQSIFNPHYLGADNILQYGRWIGVNWYWAEYLIGWHAIWSITLPILTTTLLFPSYRNTTWMAQDGVRGLIMIFVCSCIGTFGYTLYITGGFIATWSQLVIILLVITLIVNLALNVPEPIRTNGQVEIPTPKLLLVMLGITAFVGGFVWLGNHDFVISRFTALSIIGTQIVFVILVFGILVGIRHFAGYQHSWNLKQLGAIASGGLLGGAAGGIVIVQGDGILDMVGQIMLCVITMAFIVFLNVRIDNTVKKAGIKEMP